MGPPADPHAAYLQYTDISKIMGLHLPEDRRPHASTYASLKPYYQTDEDGVSKYHKIMAAAGYYVHPSKLNPRANPFTDPSTSAASSQLVAQVGERAAESAAGLDPSSSSAVQQEQAAVGDAAASSSQAAFEQLGRTGVRLNPDAAPYYPQVGSSPGHSSYPPGSPIQQQQAGRQGFPNSMQQSLQGVPNPVSQRTSQQGEGFSSNSGRVSGRYLHQTSEFADPNAQLGSNPQHSQVHMEVGSENQLPRVSSHRHHLAEKLHLPMDWHMDVLAGRAPATFSPLGDQATSGYFLPILTPDSAMHTSEYMTQATQPMRVSPNPKRYTQHALRVSAQALGYGPYSQGGQPPPPQQLTHAQPPPGSQAAGHPGLPYPSYGGNGYNTPSQTPTKGNHLPQSPSVVVYPGQNPGMASYLGHYPGQGSGYPSQHPGHPVQGPGYPTPGVGRPNQGQAYPSQRPGHPYQGAGFTITPLSPPGQGMGSAAYPHQGPQHVAPYPPQTQGFTAYAYGPQTLGGVPYSPQGGGIAAVYPGQTPVLSANPSQSSLFSSQHGQGFAAGSYPTQSGLFTQHHHSQQGQIMGGSPAYPTQQPTPAASSSQGAVTPLQQGQGWGAAGGGALGGFAVESLLGSNGKPRISGTAVLPVMTPITMHTHHLPTHTIYHTHLPYYTFTNPFYRHTIN